MTPLLGGDLLSLLSVQGPLHEASFFRQPCQQMVVLSPSADLVTVSLRDWVSQHSSSAQTKLPTARLVSSLTG